MFWSKEPKAAQDPDDDRTSSGLAADRVRMVEDQLRARGVASEKVLEAMGEIPRERFLTPGQIPFAYRDRALPLAFGQTVSQPYMVAVMTEALEVEPGHRVLEIGTGSGYQTAILARLAGEVYSIERIHELSQAAGALLQDLEILNVQLREGDGTVGWPERAPFQRILVTAGAPTAPDSLRAQLDPDGGRLVIPVGDRQVQDLISVTREGERFKTRTLLRCRFVPLLGEEGWEDPA